jgi:tRNA A-37 threonylcarbamoyl transferase component Bud32
MLPAAGRLTDMVDDEGDAISLLDPSTVGPFLVSRGVGSGAVHAKTLSGGVSNIVIGVSMGDRDFVVKQSLERLRVAAEWHAPQRRILSEAAALRIAREIDAGSAPEVIFVDSDQMVLVLERAPEPAVDWKSELLKESVDIGFAHMLGKVVGRVHRQTVDRVLPVELEEDREAFEALRLEPYHGAVIAAVPDVAESMNAIVGRIRDTRLCLVHGDLSPKNILMLDRGAALWLIDFEVAQRGDPVFDIAFLLSHLCLKSFARPASARQYDQAADAFLSSYESVGPVVDHDWLILQIGALLLARVVGKSPVEYLNQAQQKRVFALGKALVGGTFHDLNEVRRQRGTL